MNKYGVGQRVSFSPEVINEHRRSFGVDAGVYSPVTGVIEVVRMQHCGEAHRLALPVGGPGPCLAEEFIDVFSDSKPTLSYSVNVAPYARDLSLWVEENQLEPLGELPAIFGTDVRVGIKVALGSKHGPFKVESSVYRLNNYRGPFIVCQIHVTCSDDLGCLLVDPVSKQSFYYGVKDCLVLASSVLIGWYEGRKKD